MEMMIIIAAVVAVLYFRSSIKLYAKHSEDLVLLSVLESKIDMAKDRKKMAVKISDADFDNLESLESLLEKLEGK